MAGMNSIEHRFSRLATDHAPGQETRQTGHALQDAMRGEILTGTPVDFSHGDVNETAFAPTPGALDEFIAGVHRGGELA